MVINLYLSEKLRLVTAEGVSTRKKMSKEKTLVDNDWSDTDGTKKYKTSETYQKMPVKHIQHHNWDLNDAEVVVRQKKRSCRKPHVT